MHGGKREGGRATTVGTCHTVSVGKTVRSCPWLLCALYTSRLPYVRHRPAGRPNKGILKHEQ